MNITYNYALNLVGFVLPVAVIIGCYVGVIRSTLGSMARVALQLQTLVRSPVTTAALRKRQLDQEQLKQQEYRMVKV